MVAATVTNPIDVIKVRLQLQGELRKSYVKENVLIQLLKEEGIRGLGKGLSASLLREGSYSTIRMGLYEPFKNILHKEQTALPLWKKIVAGGLSGMLGAALANPSDLIKVRFQAQQGASKSLWQTAKEIFQKEGIPGLYRGVGPTTQRAMILTAVQLSTYDHSKQLLLSTQIFKEGLSAHLVGSMIAGFFAATFTSPIDLVKSRYMNQKFANGKGMVYSSTLDCFQKTIRAEGVLGLFKGWFPNWMRLGPHTIVTFIVLEQMRKFSGMKPV